MGLHTLRSLLSASIIPASKVLRRGYLIFLCGIYRWVELRAFTVLEHSIQPWVVDVLDCKFRGGCIALQWHRVQ